MKYLFVGIFVFVVFVFGVDYYFHFDDLDIISINERRGYFPVAQRLVENKYVHAFTEGRKQFFDHLQF